MEELDLNLGGDYNDEDFCRGYGTHSAEDLDDPYFEARQAQEEEYDLAEVVDKAPEMPQNFYQEVESFLTKPPPSIKDSGKLSKLGKSKGATGPAQRGVTLPDIHARNNGPSIILPQPPQVASKVRSKLMSNANKSGAANQKHIDHNLLREAFAYTDMLLKEALIEEANSANGVGDYEEATAGLPPRGKGKKTGGNAAGEKAPPRAAPADSIYMAPHPYSAPSGKKKSDGQVYLQQQQAGGGSRGVVKKLRAKVPSESALDSAAASAYASAGGTFNMNVDSGSDVGRRNPINYDELISNFEGGVMLQKLRKELEESKQSMRQSEHFMRQLSMEYFGGGDKNKGKGKGKGNK